MWKILILVTCLGLSKGQVVNRRGGCSRKEVHKGFACRSLGEMVSRGTVGEDETHGGQGTLVQKELTAKEFGFLC